MSDQNNSQERLKNLIYHVLRDYRQIEVVDEEGDGYPLVDALTITGQGVDMGEREIANIAEMLAYEIARADRAAPDTCWRCGGTGLTLNDTGEPGLCPTCKGDTVADRATPEGQGPEPVECKHLHTTVSRPGYDPLRASIKTCNDCGAVITPLVPPACQQEAVIEEMGGGDVIALIEPDQWNVEPQLAYARGWNAALLALKGDKANV